MMLTDTCSKCGNTIRIMPFIDNVDIIIQRDVINQLSYHIGRFQYKYVCTICGAINEKVKTKELTSGEIIKVILGDINE